jgi:hypothetical protein
LPCKWISPRVIECSPATDFSSVDLPHPDGPTTHTISPASTLKDTSSMATCAFEPVPYVWPSSMTSSMAGSSFQQAR